MRKKFKYAKLRGRIVELYGTQKEFASELGVPTSITSRKLSGQLGFTHEDINKWSGLLEIGKEEIGIYFFDA